MKILHRRWLLDLGNSRLKCALLDGQGHRGEIFAIGHERADANATLLRHIGPMQGHDEAWLASVAPAALTTALVSDLEAAGIRVQRVQTQAQCARLRIAYAEPARLGVDRFLALLAASERTDGPWLLVSAGSALTLDLLDSDGRHLGGSIAPMPQHMREALASRFAQLDVAPGKASDFASDTADAIASGCEGAILGLVERSLRLAEQRLGLRPTLLVGGGGAALLAGLDHWPRHDLPALLLDGLAMYVRGHSA